MLVDCRYQVDGGQQNQETWIHERDVALYLDLCERDLLVQKCSEFISDLNTARLSNLDSAPDIQFSTPGNPAQSFEEFA